MRDRDAIELFRRAMLAKKRGELEAAGRIAPATLRVELAKNIDLSKADPDCERCAGSGIAGHETAPDSTAIERICRCVARNGGVDSPLDKMLTAQKPGH